MFFINYRDYPILQNFFAIEGTTGILAVNLLGMELDRDNGTPEHLIRINFEDNFNGNGGLKLFLSL